MMVFIGFPFVMVSSNKSLTGMHGQCCLGFLKKTKPLAGLFHRLNHPARRPLDLLCVQGFEIDHAFQ